MDEFFESGFILLDGERIDIEDVHIDLSHTKKPDPRIPRSGQRFGAYKGSINRDPNDIQNLSIEVARKMTMAEVMNMIKRGYPLSDELIITREGVDNE